MPTGEPALIDFIRDAIRQRGAVTFRWFMEQVLYHPAHGYYSSDRCVIGRAGDYFTNVSVGSLFGALLAAQFAEMWESLGRPANFIIVEQGAHHGDFARDVLEAVRWRAPYFFAALRYEIIEPFPALEKRQAEALDSFRTKVTWRKSLGELAPFCGVHFSNELLDAMPVHIITAKNSWLEKYVSITDNGFALVDGPISATELQKHLRKIPKPPDSAYETEVNLEALDWIDLLSSKVERGYVLAVDYGYARDRFYSPARTQGTLRCYAKHRVIPSPLLEIGHADIAAHVDWTSVAERGEEGGLRVAGFADQHRFITGLAANLLRSELSDSSTAQSRRALQTLLHPNLLGRTFQFLALGKETPRETQLSGFKFGRDARKSLGLH